MRLGTNVTKGLAHHSAPHATPPPTHTHRRDFMLPRLNCMMVEGPGKSFEALTREYARIQLLNLTRVCVLGFGRSGAAALLLCESVLLVSCSYLILVGNQQQ